MSQTFRVSNSFDNYGIENQRALGASSFMLWLKFIDFLDLLNIGIVEFGLCELSRLME